MREKYLVVILIAVIVLSLFAVSPVCADSRVRSISVGDQRYEEGLIVFQEEILEIKVSVSEGYLLSLSDESDFEFLNKTQKYGRSTFYFFVPSNYYGDKKIKLFIVDTEGEMRGQQNLIFKVKKPYDIDLKVGDFSDEDETKKVLFEASTGLSEKQEENLNLKFNWKIKGENSALSVISGQNTGKRLDEGLYEVELVVTDRLGRVFTEDFSFIVQNTDFDYRVKLNISKTPLVYTIGQPFYFNFKGSYSDSPVLFNIYINSNSEPAMTFYYDSADLVKPYTFKEGGDKVIVVKVKKFGDSRILASTTITVKENISAFKSNTANNYEQKAEVDSRNTPAGSSPVVEEGFDHRESTSKNIPAFSIIFTVIAVLLAAWILKKKKN